MKRHSRLALLLVCVIAFTVALAFGLTDLSASKQTADAASTNFSVEDAGGNEVGTYDTFVEAVVAVPDGGTIYMLNDVVVNSTIQLNLNKTYAIDLGGYLLSYPTSSSGSLILITAGNVTIKNGSLETFENCVRLEGGSATLIDLSAESYIAVYVYGGAVNIISGYYYGEEDAVYCEIGSAVITSGRFVSTAGIYGDGTLSAAPVTGSITLASGSVPSVVTWLNSASALDVTITGPSFRIGETGYATLTDAVDAVQDGEVILMLNDVTITAEVNMGTKDYTFDLGGYTITRNGKLLYVNSGNKMIQNGSIVSTSGGHGILVEFSTVTLDNLTISCAGAYSYAIDAYKGTVHILSGSYTGDTAALRCGGSAGAGSMVTITTGFFKSTSGPCMDPGSYSTVNLADGSVADVSNWLGEATEVTVYAAGQNFVSAFELTLDIPQNCCLFNDDYATYYTFTPAADGWYALYSSDVEFDICAELWVWNLSESRFDYTDLYDKNSESFFLFVYLEASETYGFATYLRDGEDKYQENYSVTIGNACGDCGKLSSECPGNLCDCDVCPDCGGYIGEQCEDVHCKLSECLGNLCDCDVCPDCGGYIGTNCGDVHCKLVACPVSLCDCDICPDCGGYIGEQCDDVHCKLTECLGSLCNCDLCPDCSGYIGTNCSDVHCGLSKCTCSTVGNQCDVCGNDPCTCQSAPTVCPTCGENPCTCPAANPCPDCGKDPCICDNGGGGLSGGAIAGIVIGCVAFAGLGGFALYWFVFRKKKKV